MDQLLEEVGRKVHQLTQFSTISETVPYLEKKGLTGMPWQVISEPVTVAKATFQPGDMLVSMADLNTGEAVNIQLINAKGEKRFLPKGQVKGAGCWLESDGEVDRLWISESIGTGLSVHRVAKEPVLVAFSAGNISQCVTAAKLRYPNSVVVIAADNDSDKKTNVGVEVAEAVASEQQVLLSVPPEAGDWNDYFCRHGQGTTLQALMDEVRQPQPMEVTDVARALWRFPYSIGSTGYDYQSRYLIKGQLPADSFGVVYGPSGHFKSFIALALACHVATGQDWNGHRTQRNKVIYVAGEGGTGVPRRIKAWESKSRKGVTVSDLAVISQPVYLTEVGQLEALIDAATDFGGEQGVGLIILDTLARCFAGADENKTADMNQFIAKCDELRRRTGATVLVVHHSGKDAEKGARGSSALRAAADFEFSVKRTEDDQLAAWLACTKMKDDGGASDMAFPLRVVELFTDSDGDPVTSLVVSDEGYVPETQDEVKEPPSKNQTALWEVVRSRQQQGEDTHRSVVRDDLKKMGLNTNNFSRWVTALLNRGSIRLEGDKLIAI
ncbi:DNA primase [Ferrimonas sediminicola]|uniref:DNA primase n=1 Tax=Ferrimonas sediminicola TaxID=2569538 RepID=A0A4U1BFA3_9GAMM|nr:AAA family ATPase [Ferrimonas sediminicola]TKB49934.1 DNA primase [Ferrimonas sediminicola]